MKGYLTKVKTACHTLAACGCPISEEDQELSILAGLGPKFEPIMVVLTSSINSYNVSCQCSLFSFWCRALQQSLLPESPMTSNLAIGSKRLDTLTVTIHLPLKEVKSIRTDLTTFEVVTEVEDKALTPNQFVNSVKDWTCCSEMLSPFWSLLPRNRSLITEFRKCFKY